MALIFLDLDGTLTDPKPGITGAVIHALEQLEMQAPEPDELEWVIGPSLLDSFAKLGTPDPAAALDLYRAHYTAQGLFDARVYDGIPDVLRGLAVAGHRLALATAKPHVYATRITAHFGLDVHMQAQFGPELDGTRNDKGALLAHALPQVNGTADQAIMVGDRMHDLAAARANGIRFVGVLWGYGDAEELADADVLCRTPSALPDAIGTLLG